MNALPYLTQAKNRIAKVINPCIPTIDTSHLLQGNANNWLQTGLQISDEHHTQTIAALLAKLKQITEKEEQQAWEIACKWARSKYPTIQDRTFTQTAEDLCLMGIRISLRRPYYLNLRLRPPIPRTPRPSIQPTNNPPLGTPYPHGRPLSCPPRACPL
ncbi:Alpha-14 glucan phosphorylase L-2 isozyme chloroplastic/amyloplastic [Dissostichus eleginoides]|uniref:Alpha-14 glucan phosphorylase L-2 isozyme chloroplastic/amyloplastic n=1 Tax=Dissostichus eleginoides TaxID=100907 RepID=A0AAD9B169_DISEL|nr:Alpha-14 glucan phosphorylase L-2 isozyme chloroplastic/amyloplastic [Dissostichus eleginoides]